MPEVPRIFEMSILLGLVYSSIFHFIPHTVYADDLGDLDNSTRNGMVISIPWKCHPLSSVGHCDLSLCKNQLFTCPPLESRTTDPCTCCDSCPVPHGSNCGILPNPKFIGPGTRSVICAKESHCIVVSGDAGTGGTGVRGICRTPGEIKEQICDRKSTYSGCGMYADRCVCHKLELCPGQAVLFPFPDPVTCQDKLKEILASRDLGSIKPLAQIDQEWLIHPELDDPGDIAHFDGSLEAKCPSDSRVVPGDGPNSLELLPQLMTSAPLLSPLTSFHCQCDLERCKSHCEPRRSLIWNGRNDSLRSEVWKMNILSPGNPKIPGRCCPIYECLPAKGDPKSDSENIVDSNVNCHDAICPHNEAEFTCSGDSILLPSLFTHGHCCPVPQGCQCLKELCQALPICTNGQWPALIKRGNGIPGSCCDGYVCKDIGIRGSRDEMRSCKFEDRVYENGAEWKKDDCVDCFCKKGLTFCQTRNCSGEICRSLPANDTCCPDCRDKKLSCTTEDGTKHSPGDAWKEGDCVDCTCNDKGNIECMSQMCGRPQGCADDEIVKIAGVCCPTCPEEREVDLQNEVTHRVQNESSVSAFPTLVQKSKLKSLHTPQSVPSFHCWSTQLKLYFAPEQTWQEDCRMCYCMEGITLCSLLTCPIPKCEKPFFYDGDCCPSCKGHARAVPSANHTNCKDAPSYPNHPRVNTITEKENGGVIDVSSLKKMIPQNLPRFHQFYDSWWIDSCINCICRHGVVFCSVSECAPTPCNFPQTYGTSSPTTCCQSCLDEFSLHARLSLNGLNNDTYCVTSNGNTYANYDTWNEDPCNSCKCQSGEIVCHSQTCPKQYCNFPLLQKGKCCPLCLGNVGNLPYQVENTSDMTFVNKGASYPENNSQDNWLTGRIPVPGIPLFKKGSLTYQSLPFFLLLVLCTLLLGIVLYLLVFIFFKRDKVFKASTTTRKVQETEKSSSNKNTNTEISGKNISASKKKRFFFLKLSPHALLKRSLFLHSKNSTNFNRNNTNASLNKDRYVAIPTIDNPDINGIEREAMYYKDIDNVYELIAKGNETHKYINVRDPDRSIKTSGEGEEADLNNIKRDLLDNVWGVRGGAGNLERGLDMISQPHEDVTQLSESSNYEDDGETDLSSCHSSAFNRTYYSLTPKPDDGIEKMV